MKDQQWLQQQIQTQFDKLVLFDCISQLHQSQQTGINLGYLKLSSSKQLLQQWQSSSLMPEIRSKKMKVSQSSHYH